MGVGWVTGPAASNADSSTTVTVVLTGGGGWLSE